MRIVGLGEGGALDQMKADAATPKIEVLHLGPDGVLRRQQPPGSGPPDLKQLGDRVKWLLEKRSFGNPNRSNSTGVNALDAKIGAAIGYTTRLCQNRFVSIDPQRLAKIAEVLDSNLEWLVTGRGPWQRLPEYVDAPEDGRARWEAIRFAKVCGFSGAAVRYGETLHLKKRGDAPTAEEWFEMIRLREQQIRSGLVEDDPEPGSDREPQHFYELPPGYDPNELGAELDAREPADLVDDEP
jgi:hypothetical protein